MSSDITMCHFIMMSHSQVTPRITWFLILNLCHYYIRRKKSSTKRKKQEESDSSSSDASTSHDRSHDSSASSHDRSYDSSKTTPPVVSKSHHKWIYWNKNTPTQDKVIILLFKRTCLRIYCIVIIITGWTRLFLFVFLG